MRNTLRDDYGVNLENDYNNAVTIAWDQAQSHVSKYYHHLVKVTVVEEKYCFIQYLRYCWMDFESCVPLIVAVLLCS